MAHRTLTLAETLAGAERACKRVERWPQWKREVSGLKELSCIRTTEMGERDDEKIMQHLSDSKKDHIYGLYYFENFSKEDVSDHLWVSLKLIDEVLLTWVYSRSRKETPLPNGECTWDNLCEACRLDGA